MKGVTNMPQIIYTDTVVGDDGLPLNTTPAATYAVADLSTILDCVARGEIECGTGEDLPVDWPESADANLPWAQNGPQSSGPWKQY